MTRATKYCEITIHTISGTHLRGRFQIDASLSSNIRPSDAIRDMSGAYLLLSDVTLADGDESREAGTVMVRADAIAYIELGSRGWRTA